MNAVATDTGTDPFELPPVHAIVPAQPGSAPIGIASSVFDWRGSAPAEPVREFAKKVAIPVANPASQPPASESHVTNESTATTAPAATNSAGPRFRLLAVLAANGVMQREQIASATGLKAHRLSQVICDVKKAKMLRRLNEGVYEITEAGRAYVMADHAGADAKFAKPRKAQPLAVIKPTPVIAGGGAACVRGKPVQQRQLHPCQGWLQHRAGFCRVRRAAAVSAAS